MAIQFQQLGPGDATLLAEQLTRWQQLPAESRPLRKEVDRILADGFRWHAWLIRRGERAVGYLMLEFRSGSLFATPRGQVAALYVEPAARTTELGRQAERFAADVARWLHVRLVDGEPSRLDRHAPAFSGAAAPAAAPRWIDAYPTQAIA